MNGETETQNPRKRSVAPSDEEEDEEQMIDNLLPASRAIKRRRLELAEEAKRTGKPVPELFLDSQPKLEIEKPKAKKAKKEFNIKDAVRERREAEEEQARQDTENLRDTLEGMSVEEMQNLAVVEEMELPDRSNRPHRRAVNGEENERWDPRWNGRRNFKKFRRQGQNDTALRGHKHKLMVPLEEVKNKDFGIGEDYWIDSSSSKKKQKEKERATLSQSQAITETVGSQTLEVPSELAVNGEEETIDVDEPRLTRHQEQQQETQGSTLRSQAVHGKRSASSRAKEPPTKKQRTMVADSDSDSEDELKFRVRKRR